MANAHDEFAAHPSVRACGMPWLRCISARTGIQGKLVLSFMFLMVVTLAASLVQFIGESRQITEEVLGGKAATIAGTVGITSEKALRDGDTRALAILGDRIVAGGDIVGLAFFNSSGTLLSSTWRDGDGHGLHARLVPNPRENPTAVMHAQSRVDPKLGPYIEMTVPVRVAADPGQQSSWRVVGFVTVCLSQIDNTWRIGQSQAIVVLIGAVGVLVSLPTIYVLVDLIFRPIRALVEATRRIAAGDLEAEVESDRPDVIGTLAQSFNEMVKKVRQHQQQLKDANEQLAFANHDLEEKVRQRTTQVEAANERLRTEIAEKEDFLRAVSHDLNAPLRNIAGMAAMLLVKHRERFDEDVIHRLERIQKNVEVETDLIAELLELSRIKTRRQNVEPVDLNGLVSEVSGLFEDDLRSREISLIVDTPLPQVDCERARMRQVFQNLVDNAIKYMGDRATPDGDAAAPARPREIHLGCELRPGEAEFYARDTGIGIDPEDIDKVFCVFRRGRNSAAHGVAGKGVGLASVKSIVETYAGRIWVESEVGKGTTFRFTVDAKHVPAARQLATSETVRGRAA